jgi:hypothetical protein
MQKKCPAILFQVFYHCHKTYVGSCTSHLPGLRTYSVQFNDSPAKIAAAKKTKGRAQSESVKMRALLSVACS